MQVLWGVGGMVVLLAIAFALSVDRRAIRPRTVLAALAIQFGLAVIVLYWDVGKQGLRVLSGWVQSAINAANEGIDFLFGPVLPSGGGETVVAFQVLPIIVFIASLSAVLYHWRILQWVVRILGGGLQRLLGTGRAESVNAAANMFLGQTEAPLLVRPYLRGMTRSEIFAVMVGGLSTVAGTMLAGYAQLGARLDYLIAASFMAAPGGLLMAKIIIPERRDRDAQAESEQPEASQASEASEVSDESEQDSAAGRDDAQAEPRPPRNVIDAAATGASDGLRLALNVGAMLLAFVSLIALINVVLGQVGEWFGAEGLSLEQLFGYVFAPVMFLIGIPWPEAVQAASYLGEKVVLNEFIAFADFAPNAGQFSGSTATIITFALTGFANFGSLAILLGGLGGLVPARRQWIAEFGIRAVLAGTLANLMSATIAGILV